MSVPPDGVADDAVHPAAALAPTLPEPGREPATGEPGAPARLLQYGDYTCPGCRRARDIIRRTRDRLGEAVFVYRQLPSVRRTPDSEIAARAALAAARQGRFRDMHVALFDAPPRYDPASVVELARGLGLDAERFRSDLSSDAVTATLAAHREAANEAGVLVTPSVYVDGRLYDGAWDEESFIEAVQRPLGLRVKLASRDFFDWAASAGLILIAATVLALLVADLGGLGSYEAVRDLPFGLVLGDGAFLLSIGAWINDALMAVFFLLVGIEIKRELIDGELSDLSSAALPLVGALGGMAMPALIYAGTNAILGGDVHGWGVPMATDIAFTLGLMTLLGRRVPLSLTVFVSALAVADDLGAIVVIALFYGHGFHLAPFLGALAVLGLMFALNRSTVYARAPYLLLGVVLWACVHESGLHATLAGVLTAAMIPSRRRANVAGVAAQTSAIFDAELDAAAVRAPDDEGAPSKADVRPESMSMLQNALERLREPGYHLERALENWSNFLILPLFAFFNTGIALFAGGTTLASSESLGVIAGLVIGKPVGIVLACWLAVRFGIARLSSEVSWPQIAGAGCLAGVGFTMSIFIATEAFDGAALASIKLAVLVASVLAASLGMALLAWAARGRRRETPADASGPGGPGGAADGVPDGEPGSGPAPA